MKRERKERAKTDREKERRSENLNSDRTTTKLHDFGFRVSAKLKEFQTPPKRSLKLRSNDEVT